MSPRATGSGAVRLARFFIAAPRPGARVELLAGEAEHARRVLRLERGDRLAGLDGAGSCWPLVVAASARGTFEVELDGEPEREPKPGTVGAALPWIAVAVPFPRGAKPEEMVDRLTQLGVAEIVPIVTERSSLEARRESDKRRDRLHKTMREACKQSGRLWLPELRDSTSIAALLRAETDARVFWLSPRAEVGLSAALGPRPTAAHATRIVLAIGPEGGWSPDEESQLASAGAIAVRIAPHVVRVETAAEAAAAITIGAISA